MKGIKPSRKIAVVLLFGALLIMALSFSAPGNQSQVFAQEKEASHEAADEIDSDGDGIPDYDEIHGYTYNGETYFTNPRQKSTDFDPYDDYMEITGIGMPSAVLPPGRHPCVPAYPDLSVELIGIDVTAKCKITSTETKEKGSSWSIETETCERTKTDWGIEAEITPKEPYIKVKPYYHSEHEVITRMKSSRSGWSRDEWSKAIAVEPDKVAKLEFHLKLKNRGTAAAKNVKLKFNVKIGEDKVADTVWTDIVSYRIEPNKTSEEMVIEEDRDGEIVITLEELKSIECGSPITIEVTEIDADVPWHEQYISWGDYIGNINPVSSTIMADFGDGEVKEYKVWSGIKLETPQPDDYWFDISLKDAIDRTLGIREKEGETYIGWKLGEEVKLEEWTFGFDKDAFQQIKETLGEDWALDDLLSVPIRQGWVVVMKAPDIKPPEIHWAMYSKNLKTIKASVSDNEKIESVVAHVKVGDEYKDIPLMDEDGDSVFEARLTERIADIEDDYIIASDGKFETKWVNIQREQPVIIEVDDNFKDDPENHRWNTIQEGIDDAEDGDEVIVYPGTYYENVKVDKSIAIKSKEGAEAPIVQAADPADHVFEISADYVTLSGFTIEGSPVISETLKEANKVADEQAGIYLNRANYCKISDNIVLNNTYGIWLDNSSTNRITNNKASNGNFYGVLLSNSKGNNLDGNAISSNWAGIMLRSSSNNSLTNNLISDNGYNFGISGTELSHFIQNIDTSNKVNGKPIYYWVNKQDNQVPGDAGYVGIVNCKNITIKDLTLSNNGQGVLLVNSTDSRIENINASGNKYGIYLFSSSNNILTNNIANWNSYSGIYLDNSHNNSLNSNTTLGVTVEVMRTHYILSPGEGVICLNNSSGNTLTNNIVSGNVAAVYRIFRKASKLASDFSSLRKNSYPANVVGICLNYSSDNVLSDNIISESICGIGLYNSFNNVLTRNTVLKNKMKGIQLRDSSNNDIYLNNFIDNTDNVNSEGSTNIWNSPEEITYSYKGKKHTSYLGNYWSDYAGSDADGDGIGDIPYSIDPDKDNYPLMMPWENYIPSTFSFADDFSTDTGMWRYVGNAYRDIANEYVVLTESKPDQVGVIWFNKVINLPFMVEFKYKAGGGTGASGLVFMFYKQTNYTPGTGGRLGFVEDLSEDVPGYGIEFDSYRSYYPPPYFIPVYFDPSSNHIALIKDKVSNHLAYVNDERVEDNKWHKVKVIVKNSTVKVDVDGDTVLIWGGEIDRTFGGIGFSGATADDHNWHIIDNVKITTLLPRLAPIASFNFSPENPIAGEEITFDASSSNDPDGEIISYEWDLGDENTALGKIVTHAYSSAGDYTVTLTVTDNDGATDSIEKVVSVRLPGDVNGDDKVDATDLSLIAAAFNTTPDSPRYNPSADLNGDGRVDIFDLVLVGKNFGKKW